MATTRWSSNPQPICKEHRRCGLPPPSPPSSLGSAIPAIKRASRSLEFRNAGVLRCNIKNSCNTASTPRSLTNLRTCEPLKQPEDRYQPKLWTVRATMLSAYSTSPVHAKYALPRVIPCVGFFTLYTPKYDELAHSLGETHGANDSDHQHQQHEPSGHHHPCGSSFPRPQPERQKTVWISRRPNKYICNDDLIGDSRACAHQGGHSQSFRVALYGHDTFVSGCSISLQLFSAATRHHETFMMHASWQS